MNLLTRPSPSRFATMSKPIALTALGLWAICPDAHAAHATGGESAQAPATPEVAAPTATSPDQDVPETKTELVADGVHAKLELAKPGLTFSVGGSAFTTIRLSNRSKAKQIGAELVLESEVGEIVEATGKGVKTVKNGARTIATIRRLRKGKPLTVLVEVRLKAEQGATPPATKSQNRLRITLRRHGAKADAAQDDTVVVWPVADCAAAFYSELAAIRDRNSDGMGAALKKARRSDKSRPGRWLFRPSIAKTVRRRVCARWVRKWQPFQGKYRRTCARYTTRRRTITAAAKLPKSEAKIYRFAGPFVAARAIDRQLSQKQNAGWVTQRVATDLRGYLKQGKNPAICAGALQMADYFLGKMQAVRDRAASIAAKAGEARALAEAKTRAAREAISVDPGGHPGWGAAPLEAKSGEDKPDADKRDLRRLTLQVASLTSDAALVDAIRQAETGFAALRLVHQSLQNAGKDLDAASRTAIRNALGAIEAADYLGVIEGHYAALDGTIGASLTDIKDAYGRNCLCGS